MVYLALPIQNGGSFHGKLLNNQRVHHFSHIHMISWLSHGRKHMGSERQRREVLVPMAGLLPAPVLPGWDGQFMSIWDPSINILMGKMGIIWGWTNSAINLGFDDLNPPICSLWKPPKRRTAHAGTASRRKKRPLWMRGRIEGNSWWVNHFVDSQAVGLKKVGTTRDGKTSALTVSMDRPVNSQQF